MKQRTVFSGCRTTAWPPGLRLQRATAPALKRSLTQHPRTARLRVAQVERQQVGVAEPTARQSSSSTLERDARQQPQADTLESLCDIWSRNAELYGNLLAVHDPHQEGSPVMTFRQLYDTMQDFAAGLQELGVTKYDKVALFSENSARWLVADGSIMACGAAGVVRGAAAPPEEQLYIAGHSEAVGLVVQDGATLRRLLHATAAHEQAKEPHPLSSMRFVVLLWGEPSEEHHAGITCPVVSYSAVLDRGRVARRSKAFTPARVAPGDLATLVYTSGTTGHPKGVMLTHANLLYQVQNLSYFLPVQPGDRVLSLLPPWHIYERTCSYFVLSRGGHPVYTNIRRLKDDLTTFPPDHFVCVPLVLDTLHTRVRQRLAAGPRLRALIASAFLAAGAAFVRARRIVNGLSVQHALPVDAKHRGCSGSSSGSGGSSKPIGGGDGVGGLGSAEAGSARVLADGLAVARRWAQVLLAALVAAVLAPVHALAARLVYGKVREALGVRKTVISGGGSLAAHLDDFYETLGLPVLNGWGLTETSPVLACRRSEPPEQNIRGSVGLPTPGTELRVVDPDSLEPLPIGRKGLVLARGPGVMGGYYKDEAATARAFRAGDGWFDTGDLGWIAPSGVPSSRCAGHLILSGRAKDTIVLSSGKNVEPQPIEDAIAASPLIKYVVLIGQDKRELGALVWPDEEALTAGPEGSLAPEELEEQLLGEVARLNAARPDYHTFEHLAHIAVVRTPLSVDEGTLTRTLKPRRPEIMRRHADAVAALSARLRG